MPEPLRGSVCRRRSAWLLVWLVAALAGLVAGAAAQPAAVATVPSSRELTARQIGAEAYVYGVALLDEQRVISNFPANLLIDVTRLATPAERLVPAPNVDTLYTTARLVLSGGPMVVHVPAEPGRYYTLQFLDAYTNSFAYVGRRTTGTLAGDFAIVGPGWHGALPAGIRKIQSPTPTVWMLGRTLVRSAADLKRVNAIQADYTLTPLSRFPGPPNADIVLPSSTLHPAPLPRGLVFLDAMDAAMALNPPPASAGTLLRRFAQDGIGSGVQVSTEHLPPDIRRGLLQGIINGQRQVNQYQSQLAAQSERRHNGWLVPPEATGRFGTHYLLRADIAGSALGANVPAEAVYPFAYVDSTLKPLSGRHRYRLHFAPGQLPPVAGFWSLTMYDRTLFLVPNPIDRYAIGNRTPGLRPNRDGSLDILLQHQPPPGSRANWLPAPAGAFVVALRLYQPKPRVLSGAWPLPTITRIG